MVIEHYKKKNHFVKSNFRSGFFVCSKLTFIVIPYKNAVII